MSGGDPKARLERLLAEAMRLVDRAPALVQSLVALVGRRAVVRLRPTAPSAQLAWDPELDSFAVEIGTSMLEGSIVDAGDLLYVVCHELMHLVRQEHRLPEGLMGIAMNLAADALNDAFLTGPALGGFFSPTTALPSRRNVQHPELALLLPLPAAAARVGEAAEPLAPRVSRMLYEQVVRPPATAGAAPYEPRAWAEVHHALQVGGRTDTVSLDVAVRLVRPLLDQLPEPPAPRLWLPPEAARALGEIRRELRARGIGTGTGTGTAAGSRQAESTTELRLGAPSRRLERFLRGFAGDPTGAVERWTPRGPTPRATEQGTRLGRRALAEWRAGLRATPFSALEARGGDESCGLELYVDASGSMWSDLASILGTVALRCADVLALPVRAFSIGVYPVDRQQLARGRLPTDGGTDFRALAEDLLARDVTRAVVVSDGEAAPIAGTLTRALVQRGVRLGLVFPRSATARSPLDALCPKGARMGLALGDPWLRGG